MIVHTECIKNLEIQKESLIQTKESLCKNVQELEISLKDANSVLVKTKKDLEGTKELNSNYEEQNVKLQHTISKLLEQCNALTSEGSVEAKEVRLSSFLFSIQCQIF